MSASRHGIIRQLVIWSAHHFGPNWGIYGNWYWLKKSKLKQNLIRNNINARPTHVIVIFGNYIG